MTPFSLQRAHRHHDRAGFNLVEVVLALAVVSFGMLTLIGLIPGGLETAQDSEVQVAVANITQQLRGEFEPMPSTSPVDGTGQPTTTYALNQVASLGPYLYTKDGIQTTSSASNSYYTATFALGQPNAAGSGTPDTSGVTVPGDEVITTSNAQFVTVTLTSHTGTHLQFPLLIAKQTSN